MTKSANSNMLSLTGPSLTEAASSVFANTQSAGVQGLSPLSGTVHCVFSDVSIIK